MAFDLDGLAVLAGMAAKPERFAGFNVEATKIARTLLTKLLKNKATTLQNVRDMAAALPAGTLAHVTDGLSEAELGALAIRFDAQNSIAKGKDRQAKSLLVAALISGEAQPAPKAGSRGGEASAPKGAQTKRRPSSGVEAAKKIIRSKAMGARRAEKPAKT